MEIPSPFQGTKHTFHRHLAAAYMVAEEVSVGVTAAIRRLQALGHPGKVPVVKDGTYLLVNLHGLSSRLDCMARAVKGITYLTISSAWVCKCSIHP